MGLRITTARREPCGWGAGGAGARWGRCGSQGPAVLPAPIPRCSRRPDPRSGRAARKGCPPSRSAVWGHPRGTGVTGGSPRCGAGRAPGKRAENARKMRGKCAEAGARSRPGACAALSACSGQLSFNPRLLGRPWCARPAPKLGVRRAGGIEWEDSLQVPRTVFTNGFLGRLFLKKVVWGF